MEVDDDEYSMECRQREPICTRLKSILESYPANTQLLELVQVCYTCAFMCIQYCAILCGCGRGGCGIEYIHEWPLCTRKPYICFIRYLFQITFVEAVILLLVVVLGLYKCCNMKRPYLCMRTTMLGGTNISVR